MKTVLMHGPAFDKEGNASGKPVEREVPEADIAAFERVGYKKGPLEKPVEEETAEESPKKGKK